MLDGGLLKVASLFQAMGERPPQVGFPLLQPTQRQAGLSDDAVSLVGDGHAALLDQGEHFLAKGQSLPKPPLLLPDLTTLQQRIGQALGILVGPVSTLCDPRQCQRFLPPPQHVGRAGLKQRQAGGALAQRGRERRTPRH